MSTEQDLKIDRFHVFHFWLFMVVYHYARMLLNRIPQVKNGEKDKRGKVNRMVKSTKPTRKGRVFAVFGTKLCAQFGLGIKCHPKFLAHNSDQKSNFPSYKKAIKYVMPGCVEGFFNSFIQCIQPFDNALKMIS